MANKFKSPESEHNLLQKTVLKLEEWYKIVFGGTQKHFNTQMQQSTTTTQPSSKGQTPADMLERGTVKRAEGPTSHSDLSLPKVPQSKKPAEQLSAGQVTHIDHVHRNGAGILGANPTEKMVFKNPNNKSKTKVSA